MRRALFVLFVFALAAGTARAQSARETQQAEAIKALLERIDKLERRLHDVEDKLESQAPAPPSEAGTAKQADRRNVPAPPEHAHGAAQVAEQVATTRVEDTYPSLKIQGFADVDFAATDQRGTTSGFNLGQFVLHFASQLSPKVSYFGELSLSARSTGFLPEVERSVIRYDYNDFFKLSFGRYHTPINYWNTAFHHGLWLQTTISRPEMAQFGGRFIPVHFVGFLAEGTLPSGGLGLNYNVGVGNGRGSIISRGGDAGDNNNNRAWLVNIFARPTRFYGLQVGGAVYRDKISPDTGPAVRELITSAHVIWAKENPEFLAEFANVHHRNTLTGRVTNSSAFYVQTAYRLPWLEKRWKPYYRFEWIHVPASEQVLGVPDLVGSTLGVRYDISEHAAFKGEYRNTRRQPGEPRVNGLFLQTSFTF